MIIKRPIVTEKTIADYTENNRVTFEVSHYTNKTEASSTIEEVYGVTVEQTWVKNRLGKKKENRATRKTVTKTKDKKIMVFRLKKGDKIDIFTQ